MDKYEKKTWDEFRSAGMMTLVCRILRIFKWGIIESNGEVYPIKLNKRR